MADMTANTQVEVTAPEDGLHKEVHAYLLVSGAEDVQMEHTRNPVHFCPDRLEIEWIYDNLASVWKMVRVVVIGHVRLKDTTLGKPRHSREYQGLYHSSLSLETPLWIRDSISEHWPR
jgi:hypothetical protein